MNLRRRIVKRTTISERRMTTKSATTAKTDGGTDDRYRVTVVSDGPDGTEQIFESGPLGEVSIDEGADGVLRLMAKKTSS